MQGIADFVKSVCIIEIVTKKRFVTWRYDTCMFRFGNGYIAPPIQICIVFRSVFNGVSNIQNIRIIGQVCLDANHYIADSFIFIHPQNFSAVLCLAYIAEQGVTGQRVVTFYGKVPLNAAAEPRVSYREVCRLESRVDI